MILLLFWRNSPGTLPGLGPMSSPNISFLPTPSPTGTLPDPDPFLLLRVFPSLYHTHTESRNKYKVLTRNIHRNAANIQPKRFPYLYQKGTRHDKNRTVRYMNETHPPFWRNSPGTLPGPGPITSLDISFLPTPSQQGTLPDLGPFSSLGYFLPYV